MSGAIPHLGRWLFHLLSEGGDTIDGTYVAPVFLPQGVRVDSVCFAFWDRSDDLSYGRLVQISLGDNVDMAKRTDYSTYGGYLGFCENNIVDNIIDNSQYPYLAGWVLPVSSTTEPPNNLNILGVDILISYTKLYYGYLPTVRK